MYNIGTYITYVLASIIFQAYCKDWYSVNVLVMIYALYHTESTLRARLNHFLACLIQTFTFHALVKVLLFARCD